MSPGDIVYKYPDLNLIDNPMSPVSEFDEFEPRLNSAEYRFQLSAGLYLKKCNTILSGTNHI